MSVAAWVAVVLYVLGVTMSADRLAAVWSIVCAKDPSETPPNLWERVAINLTWPLGALWMALGLVFDRLDEDAP